MMKNTNTDDYLYRIGTNTLTFSVGLLFGQVTSQIIPILSKLSTSVVVAARVLSATPAPVLPESAVTAHSLQLVAMVCCIFLTMLFALVGVLVTVAYAHGELKIEFTPAYLLVTMLLIALPLYFSVQAIGSAVASIAIDDSFNLTLFRAGVGGLLIFFLAQLGYLTYIYFFDIPKQNIKKLLSPRYYIWIAGFVLAGVVFAVILFYFINTDNVLPCLLVSIGALIGSIIYLVFTPILRVPAHLLLAE